MIRYAVLLLNMLGLFVYQLFFTGDVTGSRSVPSELSPGNDYTVEITISKGAIAGFAKLQDSIPAGCTATVVEGKGASFSMSGTSVKFIWTSLPAETDFKVSYKLTVGANAPAGAKILKGHFFYVTDNLKQSVDIPASNVNVTGNAVSVVTVDPGKAVTPVAETTPVAGATPVAGTTPVAGNQGSTGTTPTGSDMSCTRKITASGDKEYTVEMIIDRGKVNGFAKLLETIPAGFSASAMQSNGASFNFTDQKVKMVWVNLPDDAEFKVSYKVSGPTAGGSIDGVVSYILNDETKKISVSASTIPGSGAADNGTTVAVAPDAGTTSDKVKPDAGNIDQAAADKAAANKAAYKIAADQAAADKAVADKAAAVKSTTVKVPAPQTAVNYKVQVMALRQTPVDVSYFQTHFGLSVGQEMHEGWTKYTTGAFGEYKPARDYRETVRGKGVINPFVTAYNSGKRITVQEALMITSQKWYR